MGRFWGSTGIMLSLSLPLPLSPLLTLHFLILILAMCRTAPLRLLTLEQAAWACDFSFPLQFSANEKVPCSVLSTLNTSPPPFRVRIAAGISEVFRILSGLHSVAKGSYSSPLEVPGLPRAHSNHLLALSHFFLLLLGSRNPSPEAHIDYAWV